jgi:hypothetical protein
MWSLKRDAVVAKHFLQMALGRVGQMRSRGINVDVHGAYRRPSQNFRGAVTRAANANAADLSLFE